MTQEEKLEKAKVNMDYKERLERAKELYPTANADQRYVLESLFPELAESEDERIRKELINWLQNTEGQVLPIDRYNAALAWLEKQSESYTKRDVDNAFVEGMALAKDELEKQGGKKTIIIPKFSVGDEIKTCNEEPLTITKIDEKGYWSGDLYICDFDESVAWDIVGEKIDNKTEPKFHKGEWVIDKQDIVHQIANVIENVTYYTYGYDIVGGGYFNDNTEGVRLWTIQDAKDGDVLYCKGENEIEYLVINKGINKCGNIDSYFRYNSLNDFGVDIPSVLSIKYDNITPATKEQRDTLFQKMKEAGYEWNAELKKVSKITTPADVDFAELSKAWAEEANKQNLANSAKTCKKSQRMISAEAKEALYDKPAWSEEDEKNLQGIINAIKELRCQSLLSEIEIYDDYIDWLKSLKQKYAWKPSDEQMDALETLYDNLKRL